MKFEEAVKEMDFWLKILISNIYFWDIIKKNFILYINKLRIRYVSIYYDYAICPDVTNITIFAVIVIIDDYRVIDSMTL